MLTYEAHFSQPVGRRSRGAQISQPRERSLLSRIRVPSHILAPAPSDQQINIPIAIKVRGANVVRLLVSGDEVILKRPLPLVLEPPNLFVTISASGRVQVTISIHVQHH